MLWLEIFSILSGAQGWTSVILVGKRDSLRHSATSFSENVVVTETSYQMLEGLTPWWIFPGCLFFLEYAESNHVLVVVVLQSKSLFCRVTQRSSPKEYFFGEERMWLKSNAYTMVMCTYVSGPLVRAFQFHSQTLVGPLLSVWSDLTGADDFRESSTRYATFSDGSSISLGQNKKAKENTSHIIISPM